MREMEENTMKAKSINRIHEMLKSDVEHTRYAYKTMKYNLEQKYNTEWLDKVITEQEKKQLNGNKQLYNEACELLEDFENHQW